MNGDCNICINGKLPSYSASCVECGLLRKNYKPFTNYDLLISKTPEELAEWILREPTIGYFAVCPPGTKDGVDCPTSPCEQCWLDWLKSPVEVDDAE